MHEWIKFNKILKVKNIAGEITKYTEKFDEANKLVGRYHKQKIPINSNPMQIK